MNIDNMLVMRRGKDEHFLGRERSERMLWKNNQVRRQLLVSPLLPLYSSRFRIEGDMRGRSVCITKYIVDMGEKDREH